MESITFADSPQDMAVLKAMVLNGTMAAALTTPLAIVRDTNPHISRRRTLTPPAIPTPGEIMAAVVKQK